MMAQPRTTKASILPLCLVAVVSCTDQLIDGNSALLLKIDQVIAPTQPLEGGLAVTVLGQNFDQETEVQLDGEEVFLLQIISDRELSFIPSAHPPGPALLTITNSTGQTVEQEQAVFYAANKIVLNGKLDLVDPQDMEGFTPLVIRSADFNNDGRSDLVVAGFHRTSGDRAARLFLNESSNQPMRLVADIETADSPFRDIADVNNDGFLDLLFEKFVVLGSDGNGWTGCRQYFGEPGEVAEALHHSAETAVGDFNGDTLPEIAMVREKDPLVLQIFSMQDLQPGTDCGLGANATRLLEIEIETVLEREDDFKQDLSQRLVVGDFNADGIDDIAYVADDMTLHTRLGPDMALVWSETPAVEYQVREILVSERSNGGPDLIGVDRTHPRLVVFRGMGDGSFAAPEVSPGLCPSEPYYESISLVESTGPASPPRSTVVSCTDGTISVMHVNNPVSNSRVSMFSRDAPQPLPLATATWGFVNDDDRSDLFYLDGNTIHALYGTENPSVGDALMYHPYPVSLEPDHVDPPYPGAPYLAALGEQRVIAASSQFVRIVGPTATGYGVLNGLDLSIDGGPCDVVALGAGRAAVLYETTDDLVVVWVEVQGDTLLETGRSTIAATISGTSPNRYYFGLAGRVRGNTPELVMATTDSLWLLSESEAPIELHLDNFLRGKPSHFFDLDDDGIDELYQAHDSQIVYWKAVAGGEPTVLWDASESIEPTTHPLHDALAYRNPRGDLEVTTVAYGRCEAGDFECYYDWGRHEAQIVWLTEESGEVALAASTSLLLAGGPKLSLHRTDVDGDTRPDLAVIPSGTGTELAIVPALSDGLVSAAQVLPIIDRDNIPHFYAGPRDLLISDITGNGLADLLISGYAYTRDQISILFNESL